jgi:glycosyltransferase involved in cell wall biosynthesis
VTKAKILLLIKSLGLGGAERLLVDSLPYLDQKRFAYEVAYLVPWKATLVPQIEAAGLPVTCLGQGSILDFGFPISDSVTKQSKIQNPKSKIQTVTAPRSLQAALATPLAYGRLYRWQQRQRFDLIHADMPVAGILARLVGRQLGVPVVYTEHNLLERYHPLTRWLHNATFGWQQQVITVSDEVQASIQRAGGDKKTTVRTLFNGVPVEQVRQEATDLDALRAEFAIPMDHQVVGSVAVFRTQKRLTDWLAVAAQVARQQPKVTFLLVGDGPEMGVVRAKVAELGLQERVRLPGFRADGRRCIGLMDLYLMTSHFEGLPIALLEAMTLAKPVVATAVGGIPEVITAGVEGQLAPTGAVAQLAQQVLALLADPVQRQRMGQQGAAKVEAHYHIKQRVTAIEAIYTTTLQSPAVGSPGTPRVGLKAG